MTDQDETISGSLETGDKSGSLPLGLLVTLEVIEGPDKGDKHEITRVRTIIGRKEADITLSDATVSGKHAVLEYAGGKLFITDNKSTNGTELNGKPVESAPVNNMDEIKLADTKLLLSVVEDKYGAFTAQPADEDTDESRLTAEEEEEEQEEATFIRRPLPNPQVPRNLQVILEVIEGVEQGKKFKAENRSTIVGRGVKADFKLEDPTISKRHFQLEVHNKDKMTVKDLASSNGTRLNERYISAVKIRHGDIVQIGNTKIKILIHVRR